MFISLLFTQIAATRGWMTNVLNRWYNTKYNSVHNFVQKNKVWMRMFACTPPPPSKKQHLWSHYYSALNVVITLCTMLLTGTAVAERLRAALQIGRSLVRCITQETYKDAVCTKKIPGGVIGIFHWHNPSDSTMALGPTKPLTEMGTRSNSRG